MNFKFKFKLGEQAKDKLTGFTGILYGASRYLTGCDQYCLKPPVDKDGNLRESKWFDEGEIEIIGKGIDAKEVKSKGNGGPRRDAPKI